MSVEPSTPALVEYKGNCHCGAFKFSFKAPEITKATECDCSICSKKSYLWYRLGQETLFVIEKGDENTTLASYEFADKRIAHKFCPTCGTAVLARLSAANGNGVLVNLRAIQNLDLWSLQPSDSFKGSELGTAYQPPPPVSPANPVSEDRALYHGNCHCGSVAYVLAHPAKVTAARTCNCSICARNGAVWIYPQTDDITFRGADEFITEYAFGKRGVFHGFCKVCGVPIYARFVGLDAKGLDRGFHRALNLRNVSNEELNLKDLEYDLFDGRALLSPLYEVPA